MDKHPNELQVFNINEARKNMASYKELLAKEVERANMWIESASKMGKNYAILSISITTDENLKKFKAVFESSGYVFELLSSGKNSTDVKVSW